jgi:pimeloyl-ACP methyl ester carboxylesterase
MRSSICSELKGSRSNVQTAMPYFRHDDLQFYFEEHGSGRPFIFSHGLGGNLDRSLELIHQLPNIHLILYDNRAHGRTNPIGDPVKLTFGTMADDMAALLDYLSIPRAFVGGVSMGAGISLAFGLRYPQRVKALVLNRPAWLDTPNPSNLAILTLIARLVESLGLERARSAFEQTEPYQDMERNCPGSAKALTDLFVNQNGDALVACLKAIPASAPVDSLDRLAALHVPSLVLGNRNDPLHPFELAQILANAIPRARFREFPSKSEDMNGHYQQFRQIVTEFLRSCDD